MKTPIQKVALAFAVLFMFVYIVTNVPAFNDAQGYNFGLFKIDPIDNVVHLLTAIFGLLAAWYSARASRWFLCLFGAFYGMDAAVGMFTQRGLLDFTVFLQAASGEPLLNPDLSIRNFLVNGPHIVIAAAMVWSGGWLSRSVLERQSR